MNIKTFQPDKNSVNVMTVFIAATVKYLRRLITHVHFRVAVRNMEERHHVNVARFPVGNLYYIGNEAAVHPLKSSRQPGLMLCGAEIQKSGQQLTPRRRVSETLYQGSKRDPVRRTVTDISRLPKVRRQQAPSVPNPGWG